MKILIVGFGSIGKRHFDNLVALGYRDFQVLTSQDLTAFEDLHRLRLCKEINLNDALAKRPDVVFVCNPTALHLETALAAAEAGCSIFLEKPVSHNLVGLEKLAALAEVKQLKIQVGFQWRYHGVLRGIRSAIAEGKIGRPVAAHAHWGEWLPGWHPWEDYRQGYAARTDLGGGVVLTLCHPFDYLRWMLGECEVVSAVGGQLSGLELDTEDTALTTLRFQSGAVGSVYLDYVGQPPKHTLQIIGKAGRIEWDALCGSAKIYTQGGRAFEMLMPGRYFERNEMFLNQTADFMDCILQDKTPTCTLHDGIRALELCLAAKSHIEKTTTFAKEPHINGFTI
ncbi:MAG: Gfo/Idh/MocA family oxidoreductase [Saprospiraceae bacterium]|nr:Gfo/Idh/MocA family oxidoreductase [Saprospiraceae bacterium]